MKIRKLFRDKYSRKISVVVFYCVRFYILSTVSVALEFTILSWFFSGEGLYESVEAGALMLIMGGAFVWPGVLVGFLPFYLLKLTPEIFTDWRVTLIAAIGYFPLVFLNANGIHSIHVCGVSVAVYVELIAMLITYHFIRLGVKEIRQKSSDNQNE